MKAALDLGCIKGNSFGTEIQIPAAPLFFFPTMLLLLNSRTKRCGVSVSCG